jgi:hypothetical protein
MSESNAPIAAQGRLPEGYREVLYWTITEKPSRVVALQIFSIPLFFAFGWVFYRLAIGLGRLSGDLEFRLLELGSIVIGIPLTFILHEIFHGLTMRLFGARPQYGVLWRQLLFYATSPGFAYRRNAYLAVALAPLVGLSLLAILGMIVFNGTFWVALLALCAAINGSGAIGDLWISMIVLRYPPEACVIDERDGIRVFLLG